MDSNDPKNWKVRKLADFGSSEPWVARVGMSLREFIDQLKLSSDQKKKAIDAFSDIFDSLSMTFISLRNIERLDKDPETPILSLSKEYHDFYDKLWVTCKDRFQKALKELNLDIGCFFQNDKNFEKGANEIIKRYKISQNDMVQMIQDKNWINRVSDLRNNYLQHKKLTKEIENAFYTVGNAKVYFHNLWTFIEDMSLLAMEEHLHPIVSFQEIPENERDPAVPRRFKMGIKPELFNK